MPECLEFLFWLYEFWILDSESSSSYKYPTLDRKIFCEKKRAHPFVGCALCRSVPLFILEVITEVYAYEGICSVIGTGLAVAIVEVEHFRLYKELRCEVVLEVCKCTHS